MKLHPLWRLASLSVITLFLAGAGCPLVPNIEEKVVELAVGASIVVPFEARGIINEKGEIACFMLDDEIDIAQILEDADVDIDDVQAISLSGVSYRVSRADAEPSRMIEDSNVMISYNGAAYVSLVNDFNAPAGAVTEFETADLNMAGVMVVNDMLDALLASVQNGTNDEIGGCAKWSGESNPVDENTNFDWEIKLDITIVGEVTVEIPN